MLALTSRSLALFQQPVNATGADLHWIVVELGIISLFFLLIMIVSVVAGIKALGAVKKVEAKIDSLQKRGEELLAEGKTKFTPFVDQAQEIMNDLQPKIRSVTSDVEAISKTVRAKVEEVGVTVSQVNGTVQDANGKTRMQLARVDGIVSSALQTTHEVSEKIQHGIRVPVNHIAGVVAGLRTGLETLVARSPWGKKPGPFDL